MYIDILKYPYFHSIVGYNIGFWVYQYTSVSSLVNMVFLISPYVQYMSLKCHYTVTVITLVLLSV